MRVSFPCKDTTQCPWPGLKPTGRPLKKKRKQQESTALTMMAGYHFSLLLIFLNCPQVPLFVIVMYVIEMLLCFLSGYFYFSQFSGHFPVSKTLLLDALALAPQSKTFVESTACFQPPLSLRKIKKEDFLFKEL